MHFGSALRLLRLERGVGLRELGRLLGVSGAYLSRVEKGHDPPPTPDRLAALADALGVDRVALVDLAGQAGPEVTGYMHRVPAAASFLLELARRDVGPAGIARLRAVLDAELPGDGPRVRSLRATDLLSPERIVLGFGGSDYEDVLSALVMRLPEGLSISKRDILQEFLRREKESSTLLGGGFALPHAALPVTFPCEALISLVILARPLPVASPDGEPLRAAMLLLFREQKDDGRLPNVSLNLLTRAARLARAVDVHALAELGSERDAYDRLSAIESTL